MTFIKLTKRYGLAVALGCISFLLRDFFSHLSEHGVYFFSVAAVAIISSYGGIGPGLLVIVISVLGSIYFLLPQLHTSMVLDRDRVMLLAFSALVSLIVCYFGARLRKTLSSMQAAKAEIERASKAKNEFFAMISHDLKNPLSAITLNTEMLLRNLSKEDVSLDQVKRQAESIQRSVIRASQLVSDILDIDKIESGTLRIERKNEDVSSIVRNAVEMIRPLAEGKTVRIRLELPESAIYAYCDRHRIMQVFSNLLGNSIKFMAEGGVLVLGARDSGDSILFWVSDTGPGIRAENLPHIFDRYWQENAAFTRAGSGLGLSIVKGIIDAHDGEISVESELGIGTTFRFSLPREASARLKTGDSLVDRIQRLRQV